MDQLSKVQLFAVWVLPVLFAITAHEVSHAWVANKLGDKTAMLMGRLTFNPLKHIDLVGTVLFPLIAFLFGGFVFGWAKPVPINYANLRKPHRDSLVVAAAGPFSNLLMSFIWAFIAKIGGWSLALGLHWALALYYMGQAGVMINIVLMVLNIVPVPPLDGGRILVGLLPRKLAYKYSRIEPFGFLVILLLLATGVLSYILWPPVVFFSRVILFLFGIDAQI